MSPVNESTTEEIEQVYLHPDNNNSASTPDGDTSLTSPPLEIDYEAAEKLRIHLFDFANRDDANECKSATDKVHRLQLSLSDDVLRRKEDKATVLHFALESERWNVARYLITFGGEKLLTDGYNIVVRNVSSQKSCLHILSEKGNFELTKLLLERLTSETLRKELLRRTVLVELEGQRPRHLSSMHIAALKGHTHLIELFRELGVDINTTNNKHDTPVLWASRGNHIETVRRLIQLGADLNLENDKGSTPLYWAVRYGYPHLVEILAKEGRANVRQQRKLGLVSPIVLASALGFHDIVRILLENGADANVKINNDQTALHVASAEGNNDVIRVLLSEGKVDVNHADSNGNTALLFATRAANIGTMKLLVDSGANIDCKNKLSQNIWDYAMQTRDNEFLKIVARLYRRAKHYKGSEAKLTFPVGKTPLHVAASSGDAEKMRCLLDMGADPKARDLSGNTFFHIAARDDRIDVIQEFLTKVDVDNPNNDGDTALHLACKNGHVRTTQILLHKAKLDARNKLGMTPLHEAVGSDAVGPDLIRTIVDMIVKASNWSLVDAVDRHGNTALHIAARRGRQEIIAELSSMNPKIANNDGDTPFHVAARSGIAFNLDTMIAVFNKPDKGVNIDQMNKRGDSCLHVCARRADVYGVGLLVACGADLGLQNRDGNAVVHVVIEESVVEPSKAEALLEVFRGITRVSARWWCMKNDHQYPTEESDFYYSLLGKAMVELTSKLYNRRGLNALAYAIKCGAVAILEEILNTPNVYRFREMGDYVFDITCLVPQTTIGGRRPPSRKKSKVGSVDDDDDDDKNRSDEKKLTRGGNGNGPQSLSCLDLVVSLEDEVLASKILDIHPFKQLVRNYWSAYQYIYAILMLVHIVYMSLYSVYVTPVSGDLHRRYNVTTGACQSGGSYSVYGLFLIWPGVLLVYEFYSVASRIYRSVSCRRRGGRENKEDEERNSGWYSSWTKFDPLSLPYTLIAALLNNLGHLTTFAFGGLVIAWYALFLCISDMSTYVKVVSMVFVLGWLFTISFTKGFEDMHVYSIMLKYIVLRDITRYLVMYVFVLLGCGFAFYVLFQVIPDGDNSYTYHSIWNTLFNVFNLMLGLGQLFDDNFDDSYASFGGSPAFLRCLYIFYIIIATVILMSLLVAMMTDTYTDIKATEGTTWKVGSLRLALQIERSLPCIKQVLRATRIVSDRISYDDETARWVMKISADQVGPAKALETDELLKTVQRLDNKLENLQVAWSELTRQFESLRSAGTAGVVSHGGGNPPLGLKRAPTLFSVVNQIRERPFTGKGRKRKDK